MKKLFVIRMQVLFMILFPALLLLSSCKKDKKESPLKTVTIQLKGANEVPAVNTAGNGTAVITFDPAVKTITYKITWQLGSASSTTTGMHFHGAADGSPLKSSPVIIPITGFDAASSGNISGTTRVLTETEAAELLAGKWYVNIHSSVYQSGEIRGNIIFQETGQSGY